MGIENRPDLLPGEPSGGYSEILGEAADNPPKAKQQGETFFALGQEWKLSCEELAFRAQFEDWLKANSMRAIADARELDADLAQNMFSAYVRDRSAGAYTWDGAACRTARTDLPGFRFQFYLLLRRCHPTIDNPRGRITREGQEEARRILEDGGESAILAMRFAMGNPVTPTRKEGNGRMETQKTARKDKMPATLDAED